MVHFTATLFALAAAATSVSAHWRDAREIHMTGSHLNATRQLNARASDEQQYLDVHNAERSRHGAGALVWDNNLAGSAQAWANQCRFEHSQAGQNLAAGTGSPSIADAVGWWNAESADYNPSNPQYSHWTQVVWKSSSRLGCAKATCAPGTIFDASYGPASYFVCHYDPVGNVIGQFDQNVQK